MPGLSPLEFAQQSGAVASVLDMRTRWRVVQGWRETFAAAVKAQTGKWVHQGFEWHAFSYEFTPSKHGLTALELYRAESATEVYVVPEDEDEPAFVCQAPAPLDFSDCETDVLVFAQDLKWTIAFTHEQPELGPYFTRAEWCSGDPA